MRSNYLTVVIKYKEGQEQPSFHADMEVLGGAVDAVMFDDGLTLLADVETELESIKEGRT